MDKAVARANNDVAFIAWHYDKKIPDCLGFAIYRTDTNSNKTEPIPSWVGFSGQSNDHWSAQPRTTWPIQKFCWRDLTATRGGCYEYEVVPMVGTADTLTPAKDRALKTNRVDLVAKFGNISAYFNRGILSTQSLVHRLSAGKSERTSFPEIHKTTP